MAYTPVKKRGVAQNESSYTQVRNRTESIPYSEMFPATQMVQRATFNNRLKEENKTPREKSLDVLRSRDMSSDSISQAKDKRSPLRKLIQAIPKSEGFEEHIFDPVARVAKFIFPTIEDSMKEAVEEDPTRTMAEIQARATELQVQAGFVGTEQDMQLDPTAGVGSIAKLPGRLITRAVEARTAKEATEVLSELGVKKSDSLIQSIIGAGNKADAEGILLNATQKKPAYTPVSTRNKDAADDIVLENLMQKSAIDFEDTDTAVRFDILKTKAKRTNLSPEEMAEARGIIESVDGKLPVNRDGVSDIQRKQANPPKKKGIIQTAKDNLRNPAMRKGGYAGRVPEEMQRSRIVNNQSESLPKSSTNRVIKINEEVDTIRQSLRSTAATVDEIGNLETKLSIIEDSLPDVQLLKQIGGKQLANGDTLSQVQATAMKKVEANPIAKDMSLTEANSVLSNQKAHNNKTVTAAREVKRANLDSVVTEAGFRNMEEADDSIRAFDSSREEITELKGELKAAKSERALANKVKEITRLATGERRSYVKYLRNQFMLNEGDIKKAAKGGDYRTMSDGKFSDFIKELEQAAVEKADTRQAKAELMDIRNRLSLQKEDNYRRTQGFPPISQMTGDQMRDYVTALEQFQEGDVFLTARQLETVDRTNLEGVKTMREARERLLKEIQKTPGNEKLTLEDVSNIQVSAFDNLRYDTALAEKNPFYNFIVNKTQTEMLNGEANFLQVQKKVNELAKAANKSRSRGLTGTVRQALIPKNDEIVKYLEAPVVDKPAFASQLTKEELDYASYIEQYYTGAYEHLVKIKELYGSRFVDQYFTHTRRDFLEAWSDDGVIKATREWWGSHKEDQMIANIIDQDTGNILPKSKFFQYSLQRTGNLEPSKNVTRVFLQYAQTFERKRMFDKIIPEIDIYTQSLTPTKLTDKGLEIDRSIKTFVNKYLNNKKGRRENFGGIIKQSGPADIAIRMGNTLVSLIDLGLSLGPSVAASVGEQVMTYQALGKIGYTKAWKRRLWDTGIKRMSDKNANSIIKEAEPFIGRNIWTELAEPSQGIMDRGLKTVFGGFAQSTVEANKLFLLGKISKDELASGKLSSQRLANLRIEAGRWRDLGSDVKSIVGSTSVGAMSTKYKGWAIPIARTNIANVSSIAKRLKDGDFKALTSQEAAETYRAIEMSTLLFLMGSYVLSEEDDETFIGKLKARAYMESMTLMGGTDPTLFLSTPRLYSFLQQLGDNLKSLVTLEEYQQDSRWGDKGDNKGAAGLQRQFTPAAFKQFGTAGSSAPASSSSGGSVDFGFGDLSGDSGSGEVDFGFGDMDFGLGDN